MKIFAFQKDIQTIPDKDVELIPLSNNPTMQRVWRLLFFLKKGIVKQYAKQLKDFDKVIVYQYPLTLIANKAKKLYGNKLHYQYYDCGVAHPHLFRSFIERTYMKMFKYFLYKSISNIDSAVSISKYLSDELFKDTKFRSKVRLLTIDETRFNINVSPCMKTGKKTFLYVGRISPHKGIHLLIQAFNKVKEKIPNSELWIVGKNTFPNYQKELEALIKYPDAVKFIGYVDDKDLPKYYKASNAYTTCSLWEGFDMCIKEANACGIPAICFDLCSHPEVLKNGKLIKAGDIDAFAEAMINV